MAAGIRTELKRRYPAVKYELAVATDPLVVTFRPDPGTLDLVAVVDLVVKTQSRWNDGMTDFADSCGDDPVDLILLGLAFEFRVVVPRAVGAQLVPWLGGGR